MYEDFYQLGSLPFENTADPRFFFASEQHREALAAIEYTLRMRKGFVMVTGDIGSGKTTVATTMRHRCSQVANIVPLMHGHTTPQELLRHILRNLAIKTSRHDDHARLLERLGNYLRSESPSNKPLVLFIDEAQTLSDEAIEELRLLSNFDTATHKPVQVVLCGQPELRQRICQPKFDALRQRIVMAKQLTPMSAGDVSDYIAHRLTAAAIDPQNQVASFSEQAVHEIFKLSNGLPRLINVACDNCMLLGFVQEKHVIDAAMVKHVAKDMIPTFQFDSNTVQSSINQTPTNSGSGSRPASIPMPQRLSLTGTL